jgi:hypothetical protein
MRDSLGSRTLTLMRPAYALLGILSLAPSLAQSQAPVRQADFVVAGVSSQIDSAAVRQLLGRPDSVTSTDHPFDVGGKLVDWWYHRLRVSYNGGEKVGGVWLLAPGVQTSRGLRIGDPRQRVRQLYGAPASVDTASDAWVYHDADEATEMHLIKVFFRGNRVTTVFLGWVLD